jgi:branched-chain amino acid transport system substrate-binding protein
MERQASEIVKQAGGTVVGAVRHPLSSSDFSSYLLQAQSSQATVIAFANSGSDFTNAAKQAAEFGIVGSKQSLAALAVYLTDMKSLGLESAQGIYLSEPFYWDLNDQTRAFAQKFAARHGGAMPTAYQAGVYSGVLHYLKAVAALGSDLDGRVIVAKMKELPTEDLAFGKGSVREDGRKMHPMYLFKVKSPKASKSPWDLYEKVGETPAAEAFKAPDPACPLVK